MTKRTFVIVIALFLPLIALMLLTQAPPDNAIAQSVTARKMDTVNSTQKDAQVSMPSVLLPPLEGDGAANDTNAKPKPLLAQPPAHTLEEARQRVRNRLEQLEKMNEDDWEAEQEQKSALRRRWDNLPAAQRLKLIQKASPSGAPQATPQVAPQKQAPKLPDLGPRKE